MLGRKSVNAEECFKNNYVGVDFSFNFNLQDELVENWKDFNKKFIQVLKFRHGKKCTPTVDMNMMTPSKIGTKIRCIITCCVRGNVDENVDEEKDEDEEEAEMD